MRNFSKDPCGLPSDCVVLLLSVIVHLFCGSVGSNWGCVVLFWDFEGFMMNSEVV